MPEPVLAIGLIAGYAALYPLTRQGTALSPMAGAVKCNASLLTEHVERSVALFGAKVGALNGLRSLAIECSLPDWDGYGAEPVSGDALERAEVFLRSLPDDLPLPELSVEPDGAVSLDWLPTRTRSFSVSIGESDRIAYAWIDGTDRGHAVARSVSGEAPGRILEELKQIVPHAPAIRAA
jgi:hypothetical protein